MDQDYIKIDDETKLSIVAGFALREDNQLDHETFIPVALTKYEHIADELLAIDVQINDQPPSAYKLLAESLRLIADDLEETAETAK